MLLRLEETDPTRRVDIQGPKQRINRIVIKGPGKSSIQTRRKLFHWEANKGIKRGFIIIIGLQPGQVHVRPGTIYHSTRDTGRHIIRGGVTLLGEAGRRKGLFQLRGNRICGSDLHFLQPQGSSVSCEASLVRAGRTLWKLVLSWQLFAQYPGFPNRKQVLSEDGLALLGLHDGRSLCKVVFNWPVMYLYSSLFAYLAVFFFFSPSWSLVK